MSLHIALRNLLAHKTSTFIVAIIILFGTTLMVVGTSFIDSVNRSMQHAITASVSGHLQVYSSTAEDDLALFGGGMGGSANLGQMPSFSAVRDVIESMDEVKAVVPMGMISSTVHSDGNQIDQALAALRVAVDQADKASQRALIEKLQNIARDISAEWKERIKLTADTEKRTRELEQVNRLSSTDFLSEFEKDPRGSLYFLDTEIAPLAESGRIDYFRNLGTDITRFSNLFDTFEIAKGEMVPEGQRGYLLSQRSYEKRLKNKVAREFDTIARELRDFGNTIAETSPLANRVRRLPRQYRRITYELSAEDANALSAALSREIPEATGTLKEKVETFLTLTDANFEGRYKFFYESIAPMLRLYRYDIGDEITLRAITKSGYFKSLNVKVYGVYRFRGLESADIAGAMNLLDMLSFRELYGVMTEDMKAELSAIRDEVGVEDVSRDDAEDALFAGDDSLELAVEDDSFEPLEGDFAPEVVREARLDQFDQADIDTGFAVHAAVILHDPSTIGSVQAKIEGLSESNNLALKVVDWQQAAGLIGQFILVLRVVLYVAIFIIFLVALVIINNSMVMATLERVGEIGTMRAIGAQRGFIIKLFLIEIIVLGVAAGALGSLLGYGIITWLGSVGIPAPSPQITFLFSGPKLYPTIGMEHIATGMLVVLFMSLVSTLYPARIGSRIEPIVAMEGQE